MYICTHISTWIHRLVCLYMCVHIYMYRPALGSPCNIHARHQITCNSVAIASLKPLSLFCKVPSQCQNPVIPGHPPMSQPLAALVAVAATGSQLLGSLAMASWSWRRSWRSRLWSAMRLSTVRFVNFGPMGPQSGRTTRSASSTRRIRRSRRHQSITIARAAV